MRMAACVRVRTESGSWLRFLPAFEIAGRAVVARRALGLADAFGFSAHVSPITAAPAVLFFPPPCSAIATIFADKHGLFDQDTDPPIAYKDTRFRHKNHPQLTAHRTPPSHPKPTQKPNAPPIPIPIHSPRSSLPFKQQHGQQQQQQGVALAMAIVQRYGAIPPSDESTELLRTVHTDFPTPLFDSPPKKKDSLAGPTSGWDFRGEIGLEHS